MKKIHHQYFVEQIENFKWLYINNKKKRKKPKYFENYITSIIVNKVIRAELVSSFSDGSSSGYKEKSV